MRNKIIIIVLISAFKINAQVNLVPNPSFESYTYCPFGTAQLDCTSNWFFAAGSTDYYNACSPQGNMSVPYNVRGFQYASSGEAYIGMITLGLNEPNPPYYREPAMTKLSQALSIGTKYFVSFKAVLTINDFEACCASNKLGALFSKVPYSITDKAPINNFAHVYTNSIISDTLNWTMIAGSFIADSAYEYITIGNFFSSPNTSFIDYKNDFPATSAAYYYIDDVIVSTDSDFVYSNIKKTPFNLNSLNLYFNSTNNTIFVDTDLNDYLCLELKDILGRTIYTTTFHASCRVDFSAFISGTYIVQIIDLKRKSLLKTKKIIKL
ncbi:MAG: T9SS type A sorting domain-containing protein [Sphingobacteriaceae bacterium]|nr:T9SS type A sorting domain-containing protein [Sphingobacteriaceae bacterium]